MRSILVAIRYLENGYLEGFHDNKLYEEDHCQNRQQSEAGPNDLGYGSERLWRPMPEAKQVLRLEISIPGAATFVHDWTIRIAMDADDRARRGNQTSVGIESWPRPGRDQK